MSQASPRDATNFPFLVLGNKADVDAARHAVTEEKAKAWCAEHDDIPHYMVSAKDGTNVEQAFLDVVSKAVGRSKDDDVPIPDSVNLDDRDKRGDDSCAC